MEFTKIIKEVEFRTGELVDFKKPNHIYVLSEVLSYYGYGTIKNEIIKTLIEGPNDGDNAKSSKDVDKEESQKSGYTSIGGAFYVKNGDAEKRAGNEGGFQAKNDGAQRYVLDKASGKFKPTDDKETPVKDEPGIEPKNLEKSKEGGEDDVSDKEQDDKAAEQEVQNNINQTFSTPETQSRIEDESNAAKDDDEHTPTGELYSLGNGYYSTTKNGKPQFKRADSDSKKSVVKTIKEGAEKLPISVEVVPIVANDNIINAQSKTAKSRDLGVSGMGGPIASQGESRYVNALNEYDAAEFQKQNQVTIQKNTEYFSNKKLTVAEVNTIRSLGYDVNDPVELAKGIAYLATRKSFVSLELSRIQSIKPSVFYSAKGFNKSDGKYNEWMIAAFDGVHTTRQILERSTILDTTKPYYAVQSENIIDNHTVELLESKLQEALNSNSGDDVDFYREEIESFNHNKKYHDTYVIGTDKHGRTTVVSVSNKKGDSLKDPHNNTTPVARYNIIRDVYGKSVAKNVHDSLEQGIQDVTSIQLTSSLQSRSLNLENDPDLDSLGMIFESKDMKKYMSLLKNHAKFNNYLKDNGTDFGSLSGSQKLVYVEKFMNLEKEPPAYGKFGKIFVKMGEISMNGTYRTKMKKTRKDVNWDSLNLQKCMDMKTTEKETVSRSHSHVVDNIITADKNLGYPKNGENGPHVKGYIQTVMDAVHFNSYIDDSNGKMILQMGIVGVQAPDIRLCLSDLVGFDGESETPEGKNKLKQHIISKSKMNPKTGTIVITSEGGEQELAYDTWRMAGTAQKVASGFGSDMIKCLKNKFSNSK